MRLGCDSQPKCFPAPLRNLEAIQIKRERWGQIPRARGRLFVLFILPIYSLSLIRCSCRSKSWLRVGRKRSGATHVTIACSHPARVDRERQRFQQLQSVTPLIDGTLPAALYELRPVHLHDRQQQQQQHRRSGFNSLPTHRVAARCPAPQFPAYDP